VYIVPISDPGQAIGLGISEGKGSNSFSRSPADAGNENAYWLVYEMSATDAFSV